MTSIKSFISSSLSCFTRGSDSTQNRSTRQAKNAGQETASAAKRAATSASDRENLGKKSRMDRLRALSLFGSKKKQRATSTDRAGEFAGAQEFTPNTPIKTGWYDKRLPVTGLNAILFLEPIPECIQLDLLDGLSWAEKAQNLKLALRHLQEMPDKISNLSIPEKAALREIFSDMLTKVREKQSEIEGVLNPPSSEGDAASFQSEIREESPLDLEEEDAAPFQSEIRAERLPEGLVSARITLTTLSDVEEQIEKLSDMLRPVTERLREQAQRLRELDSAHEEAEKLNEETRLEELKESGFEFGTDTDNTIREISEILQTPEVELLNPTKESTEIIHSKIMQDPDFKLLDPEETKEIIQKALSKQVSKREWADGQVRENWGGTLYEQKKERIKVANEIVDLLQEAAREGTDLSNELSTDEIGYLTKGMGMAESSPGTRGLVEGDAKKALLVDGKERDVKDITRRDETDPLAKLTADLLHKLQLQERLLTPLGDLAENLDESINRLQSNQPDSAPAVLESTREILTKLTRIDKAEVSRLCRHDETKGETGRRLIIDSLELIETKAKTLSDTIHGIPQLLARGNFTTEDRDLYEITEEDRDLYEIDHERINSPIFNVPQLPESSSFMAEESNLYEISPEMLRAPIFDRPQSSSTAEDPLLPLPRAAKLLVQVQSRVKEFREATKLLAHVEPQVQEPRRGRNRNWIQRMYYATHVHDRKYPLLAHVEPRVQETSVQAPPVQELRVRSQNRFQKMYYSLHVKDRKYPG